MAIPLRAVLSCTSLPLAWTLANPGLFFVYFRSFQTNNKISTTNQCPSSIWCRDSNPRPHKHELSPITTRPGLPPSCLFLPFILLNRKVTKNYFCFYFRLANFDPVPAQILFTLNLTFICRPSILKVAFTQGQITPLKMVVCLLKKYSFFQMAKTTAYYAA